METSKIKAGAVGLLLVTACGSIFVGTLVSGIYQPIRRLVRAEPLSGTVRGRSIETRADSKSMYKYAPVVTYRYTYEGKTYENDNVRLGVIEAFETESGAQAVLDRYSPGKEVTVYVQPDVPSKSFLIWTWPSISVWIIAAMTLLFALIGIKILVDLARGRDLSTPT